MRVAVVGIDKKVIENELKMHGFSIDKLNPDVVISFGGDGSALSAEQLYPSVPRLVIKHSKICKKCTVGGGHNFSGIFDKLKKRKYKVVKMMKIEGVVNNNKRKRLVGLNEINVAHAFPTRAMRFDVSADKKSIAADMIGDGVLVATPYGSTAYFRIITGRRFSNGMGIAFNNINEKVKYRFAHENAEIKIRVNRGPALMCADNNSTMIPLRDGDVVTVKKSKEKAKIIELAGEERKIQL